jgi:hypothetical protein
MHHNPHSIRNAQIWPVGSWRVPQYTESVDLLAGGQPPGVPMCRRRARDRICGWPMVTGFRCRWLQAPCGCSEGNEGRSWGAPAVGSRLANGRTWPWSAATAPHPQDHGTRRRKDHRHPKTEESSEGGRIRLRGHWRHWQANCQWPPGKPLPNVSRICARPPAAPPATLAAFAGGL